MRVWHELSQNVLFIKDVILPVRILTCFCVFAPNATHPDSLQCVEERTRVPGVIPTASRIDFRTGLEITLRTLSVALAICMMPA